MDPVGKHCSNRLFEWTMALAMSSFGLHCLLLPQTLVNSRYSAVLFVVSPFIFALACFVIGGLRVVVLSKNGEWARWGPNLRAIIAICAGVIWCQIAVALSQSPAGAPSPGMWVYFALMAAEFRSVWRAQRDGHRP